MKELSYDQQLCLRLISYAIHSCKKVEDMKMSEIKEAVSVFFDDDIIDGIIEYMANPPETLTPLAAGSANICAAPSCDKKGIYNIWLCCNHAHRPAAEARQLDA